MRKFGYFAAALALVVLAVCVFALAAPKVSAAETGAVPASSSASSGDESSVSAASIADSEVPLAAFAASWSVLGLISVAVALAISAWAAWLLKSQGFSHAAFKLLAILFGGLVAVLFFLTNPLNGRAVFTNHTSLPLALLVLVQAVVMLAGLRRMEDMPKE